MKVFHFFKGVMDNIRSRIVDWWRGRPTVWKFILGIGAAVSVINGVIELYKNIWNEPISDVPVVFSEQRENKVLPPCLDSFSYKTNTTKAAVFNGEDVGFMLRKMATAYNVDRDYDGAKKYADILTRFFESLDKDDHRFDNEKLCVLSAQMQEALFAKDYKKLIAHYDNMCSITSAVHMMNIAMFDVAKLRMSGKRLFFFSPDQLGELRKWDKKSCQDYLSYLANWGYLQPLMIDQLAKTHRPFYYEDYFSLDKGLPYYPCLRVVATNVFGEVVNSNEATLQWVGRDKFESVDVDKCVAETLGLKKEEIDKHSIYLTVERTKDDKCSSRWEIDPEAGVSTNCLFSVQGRAKWKRGINQDNLLRGRYVATRTRTKTVSEYHIPNQIWIVIIILIMMAFSNSAPPPPKKKEES